MPRPIDPNELAAAIALAPARTRTMLLLAAYAGLRVSEIGRVRGDDVHNDALFVQGKGGQTWMVPLHQVLLEQVPLYPLHDWWFEGQPAGRGLSRVRVWQHMRCALDRVGSAATPHQVRHFYGTSLLDAGANIRVVQQLLRHANLNTTQIYTQVRSDDCRAAIAALPVITKTA